MSIINQPFQGQLGEILRGELNANYTSFTIFSAFAKNSGVLRLKESLEKFRANHGKIKAFIGIDLDGTSYEALSNLFTLCDELYVIHSQNFSTTYHSKIYLLENSDSAWCAVGSNNLTGGGLWTIFESCSIQTYDLPALSGDLDSIHSIIDKYIDPKYECSAKITSKEKIDELLGANYISKEVIQKIDNISRRDLKKKKQKKTALFGYEKVSIPAIVTMDKRRDYFEKPKDPVADYVVQSSSEKPAFTNEQFWFEMRKSTGGSRNILDFL